jgi:hypothetical protein
MRTQTALLGMLLSSVLIVPTAAFAQANVFGSVESVNNQWESYKKGYQHMADNFAHCAPAIKDGNTWAGGTGSILQKFSAITAKNCDSVPAASKAKCTAWVANAEKVRAAAKPCLEGIAAVTKDQAAIAGEVKYMGEAKAEKEIEIPKLKSGAILLSSLIKMTDRLATDDKTTYKGNLCGSSSADTKAKVDAKIKDICEPMAKNALIMNSTLAY